MTDATGIPWVSVIGLIALLLCIVLAWWLGGRSWKQRNQELQAQLDEMLGQYRSVENELTELRLQRARFEERSEQLAGQLEQLRGELVAEQQDLESAREALANERLNSGRLETTLAAEQRAAAEKLALLEEAKTKLASEFKLLANQIFEEKGKRFSEQNRSSLDEVLAPMREQLGEFRKRVDEVHHNDTKERAELQTHLKQLEKLNRQMSEDALSLTHALKGDSKAQGNWGEMILERLLEATGLREGHEFIREQNFIDEDGNRYRPDVVVYMPGNKQVIIDSKVTLTDYERAVSAAESSDREMAVKAHLRSLKEHIKALSSKRYDHLPNVTSPDYVLMFVPIEGAYLMAIEADQSVFESAFVQRVAVVTPSTLYATLKLIEQLWRSERQSESVLQLIERAGKLHDKMALFVESFEDIGKSLGNAQKSYDTAMDRMKTGRGNVIKQIHYFGKLAGKTKKELPAHMIESSALSDESDPLGEDN